MFRKDKKRKHKVKDELKKIFEDYQNRKKQDGEGKHNQID